MNNNSQHTDNFDCLKSVFRTRDPLNNYLFHLYPGSANVPVDAELFFDFYWADSTQFDSLEYNTSCSLIYLPKDSAIDDNAYTTHADLNAEYIGRKYKKKPRRLSGYISHYNDKNNGFYFTGSTHKLKEKQNTITERLADLDYRLSSYNPTQLRAAITRMFSANESSPYYFEDNNTLSEESFAMLLGRLIRDAGTSGDKLFYCFSQSDEETCRYLKLFSDIRDLLNRISCPPKTVFNFLIFCHRYPIPNGASNAEELDLSDLQEFWLYKPPYYQSSFFESILGIRLQRLRDYLTCGSNVECRDKVQKAERQLAYIQKLVQKHAYSDKLEAKSFKQLVACVCSKWDKLSKLDETDNIQNLIGDIIVLL